jgi:hypothetical protein
MYPWVLLLFSCRLPPCLHIYALVFSLLLFSLALFEVGTGDVRATLKPFPPELLRTVMELEKDILPVAARPGDPLVPNAIGGRGPGRGGRGRGRGGRGRGGSGAGADAEVVGLSAFADVNAAALEAQSGGSRKRKHVDEEYVPPRPVPKVNPAAAAASSASAAAMAANRNVDFYPAITAVFDKFWNLQFDNRNITAALFAQITMYNCHDFGLDAYAEESTCLPVIKERIDRRLYRTTDEFVLDFRSLFENTIQYYPRGGEVATKGADLLAEFDAVWAAAKKKLYGLPA